MVKNIKDYPHHTHIIARGVVECRNGPPNCALQKTEQADVDKQRGGTASGRPKRKAGR